MSFAFAQRHQILAVAADEHTITIASAQPWVSSWEADLKQVLKRPIRRVIANPQEIQRLSVEFFNVAKSVTGAVLNDQKTSNPANLEQLLTLGSASQEPDANDAHIVNIVDWLFQYAFEQRASDIHIEPRRERGGVRFRIDGVLHTVYQFPQPPSRKACTASPTLVATSRVAMFSTASTTCSAAISEYAGGCKR